MPQVIVAPKIYAIKRNGKTEYAINFQVSFGPNPNIQNPWRGKDVWVDLYTLNFSNLPGSVATVPDIRSLIFSQTFLPIADSGLAGDGALDIYNVQTQQLLSFGSPLPPLAYNPPNPPGPQYGGMVLTGCIPFFASSTGAVEFAKEGPFVGSGPPLTPGLILNATLYSYEQPAYMNAGTCQNLP